MKNIKTALCKLMRREYFPLLILLLVIVGLHLATIARPNQVVFDETYYVTDARSIITAHTDLRLEHPPLAKLIVAGGIEVFGDNPWGWRMPAVILSTIALVAFYDICRKLGTSHKTAFMATLLLGLENLMFIHSGLALLDIYVVVFSIMAFWFYLKGPRWWWAAGLLVALAGISKFSGILSIVPIILHWLIAGYKQNMGEPIAVAPHEVQGIAPPSVEAPTVDSVQIYDALGVASGEASIVMPSADDPNVPVEQNETTKKRNFWTAHPGAVIFVSSMALAPIAFFLLYGVFDMIIWAKWIPLLVWGHWNQGIVGAIRTAFSLTDSIKFSYGGAFPGRPWEWILSPTGSFYFYDWLLHPDKYRTIFLAYSYVPNYSALLSPSLWIGGLAVIPFAIWKAFKKNNAAIFIICWIIGTWLVWIPLVLASNRITYMFYYLPTIGAVALGTALILTALLKRAQERASGFPKRILELAVVSFLLFHLLCFCALSPLQLWISIPVCALLLFFAMWYLGFGWRFIIEFYDSGVFAALITRFILFHHLVNLLQRYFVAGMPGVLLLWVVCGVTGIALAWMIYALVHFVLDLINKISTTSTSASTA
jgi:hypothetical protein